MSTPQNPLAGERLISRSELRQFVSASDMALWRWIKTGKFVKPVYIGTRRYWRQSEIEKWLKQQSAAS
jgi:predicted DNA-binding transcriptional regulator AlpA